MRSVDGVHSAIQWLTSLPQESTEVHLTQEKVEQLRAALLDPNDEPADHRTSVELSTNTLA
ncbi:MAG: hypothetical protein KDK78_00060, partial [Chlamydiia bacterium]|nr:hypothetical protein [Chlamydiia bacterium]